MKIVLINHSDSRGGASVVTYRLMQAFCDAGVDARMLVLHKATDDPRVVVARPRWRAKAAFLAEHLRILAGNGLDRSSMFRVSIATHGMALARHPLVREADAVILAWINQGMLSLGEIARMAADGKKILWAMHDMWNLTGVCHHAGECRAFTLPAGCSRCPLLGNGAGPRDLSHSTWERKKKLYSTAGIHFVAVSSWLAQRAAEASLMQGQNVSVIPNAFPIDEFSSVPALSRAELGLPEGKRIILMGAARLDDPVKGLPYAMEALNRLADMPHPDAVAVFFGHIRDPHALDGLRFPHITLGTVASPERLRALYAHADVVLSSSLYETLPGTLIEGQAAGCFPVAFGRGGQADIITSPETGHIAPFADTASLAQGILRGIERRFDPAALRQSVANLFAPRIVVQKYLELIQKQV